MVVEILIVFRGGVRISFHCNEQSEAHLKSHGYHKVNKSPPAGYVESENALELIIEACGLARCARAVMCTTLRPLYSVLSAVREAATPRYLLTAFQLRDNYHAVTILILQKS